MPEETEEAIIETEVTETEEPQAESTEDATAAASGSDETLGDAGRRALESERAARKAAEKAARDAQKRVDEMTRAQETEQERLQREAEEGKALAEKAMQTLQQANLLTALAEAGLTGAKAKAAVKLIESVDFDDDQQPLNLDERIEAAKAEYGEEVFSTAAPAAARPDLHEGPRRDAEPDEDEAFAAYMRQHFPQQVAAEQT